MKKATKVNEGLTAFVSPGPARDAGSVVVLSANLVGIMPVDLPANQLGAAEIYGTWKVAKAAVAIAVGDVLYWDAAANPVSGPPGSGAFTNVAGIFAGRALSAATAADSEVLLFLHPRMT